MKRPTLESPRLNALRETFREQWRQLRELQWRELDLKEAGSWPASLQWLIALGVLLGSIWATQWLLASSPRETHESLVMQEQQALQRFETLSYQAVNLPAMEHQMEVLEGRMQSVLEMLPSDAEVPALLDAISEAARQQQLDIDSIKLRPAIVQEFYGVGRLIIIYTVASASGFALTSLMFQPAIPLGPFRGAYFTVGASAPLFGLFGALIVYSKRTGQTALGQEIWRWVMIFVVIGLIVPIIDNWAHLGGYAGGWLAASVLDPLKDESPTHMLIGLVCLLLTAASIVASVVLGIPLFQQG